MIAEQPEKRQTWTGFEPLTSAMPVQRFPPEKELSTLPTPLQKKMKNVDIPDASVGNGNLVFSFVGAVNIVLLTLD